ncbi:MAG TPA: hypothetical protein PLP29_12805 [Candidatus Ozemobacteraceae bacterium]|nr:hypothetical protein [Candidatus Ozemobacteraceae bacterium]
MKYCWDVYNKSECDTCHYYKSFTDGTLNLEKDANARDVVIVPDAIAAAVVAAPPETPVETTA